MAVNRYQTHKDYFRVGSVSAVSGGKSTTIRRTLDLPYEQLAYKQFAQNAAKDVAGVVQSTENVKQSAQSLVNTNVTSQTNITQKVQDFIHTYHTWQDQLEDSPDYISHPQLQDLEKQLKQPDELDRKSLMNLTSFAGSLANRIDRLQQLPSASMFELSASPLNPYSQYQSQLSAYLPVPMRGLLVDAKM
ncbi:hypothetical protein D3C86_1460720 [compost metagenome]